MTNLDSSTKLQMLLGGAVATNHVFAIASWIDLTSTTSTLGLTTTSDNGTTAVDIIAAPSASTYRAVKSIFLQNADTASITLTIRTNNGGTTRNEIIVTLQVGDNFQYEDGAGYFVLDSNGQIRQSGSTTGRLIEKTQYLTSGSSATYTLPANCQGIEIEMVGGGGGGGGAAQTAVSCAAGGGSSSGSFLRAYIPFVSGQTTATYTIGTHGAGGTAGNNNGNVGNDTTFIYNSVTYTAKGAGASVVASGSAAGVVVNVVSGGSTTTSTGGDVNGRGEPGEVGITLSGTVGASGSGGSSPFGGGGVGLTAEGAGTNATGYGGGGGGALCLGTTARAGGDGTDGVIIIHEYY